MASAKRSGGPTMNCWPHRKDPASKPQAETTREESTQITGRSSLGLASKRQRHTYARQIHHVAVYPANTPPKYVEVPITFDPEDAEGLYFLHQDSLVIFRKCRRL